MIMSPAGLELLVCCRIVGTPANGIPRNTLSTKPGLACVPNLLLNIWTQVLPFWLHPGVAALADNAPHRADAADHNQRRRGGEHLALDGHDSSLRGTPRRLVRTGSVPT
jgi:hypothetical protein